MGRKLQYGMLQGVGGGALKGYDDSSDPRCNMAWRSPFMETKWICSRDTPRHCTRFLLKMVDPCLRGLVHAYTTQMLA
ncbi:hypothetical protein BAUCODRAFT_373418 [Baudoinia panamericana UAMH 10762]|uniref:Uncharacterized protein n=1 Tax=Baudoinia panamericana (strain UAMH 10762) TaxID=717646 RepID=M2NMB2_BAUPA|nr:uncharacterized protein BAUCODRAFT_373418 [Baudoinia panamericana UAMH 10762]EMD00321.1 hypothetical protein BAUCODRAFT_373418 [Baudoinia panamericana UAMH 10762]